MNNGLKFNYNKNFSSLKKFKCRHGMTTDIFGNTSMVDNLTKCPATLPLMQYTKANTAVRLLPQHGNEVIVTNARLFNEINYFKCDGAVHVKIPGQKIMPTMISTAADCPTVLFTDRKNNFIAIAHCGWRSIRENIIAETIKKITHVHLPGLPKSHPKDIIVGIMGGICGRCYDVGPEFNKYFPGYVKNGRISLKGVIIDRLRQCGVLRKNIISANCCSKHTKDGDSYIFSSYRRNQTDGHLNAVYIAYS